MIIATVFDRLVYGFNSGMPDSGTPVTMAGIARSDLLAFHQGISRRTMPSSPSAA
jgi:hypothetical protein